jgi:hypothetical protein
VKTKRKKQGGFSMDALLTKMIGQKPDDGEDFWVFAIVRENPALPTYEERVATFGTYEQCAQHCAAMVNGMVVAALPQGGIRIESYQNETLNNPQHPYQAMKANTFAAKDGWDTHSLTVFINRIELCESTADRKA